MSKHIYKKPTHLFIQELYFGFSIYKSLYIVYIHLYIIEKLHMKSNTSETGCVYAYVPFALYISCYYFKYI